MNDVNGKQLSVMIFFIPLIFKMSMLPSYLHRTSGVDGYIIVGLFALAEFLQLWAVLFVCERGGMNGIRERYGNVVYLLLSCPLLLVIGVKSILFVTEIVNYLTTFLFYNVIDAPIVLSLLLVCFYFATKGARSIARIFELTLWLLPVILLMGLIFGETTLQGEYLLSVFAGGGSSILTAIGKYLVYTFDFSPLLFCNIKVKRKIGIGIFSLFSILVTMGCYMLFYCRYGRASYLMGCAFARLASFDTVITEVGSLDWISCILWVTTAILNLSLKLNAVAEISTGFRLKRHWGVGLFTLLLAFLLLKVWVNVDKAFTMASSGIQYVVFGIEVALPFIMIILYSHPQKKEPVCAVNVNGSPR